MPKPMTMIITVEEIAFGKVFRILDTMPGVVSISLTGQGPKMPGKLNGSHKGQKMGGANTVPCLVLGALIEADGKSLNRSDLIPAVEAAGKRATSVPDALTKLIKLSCIKRKEGQITITATGRKHYETACAIQAPTEEG